jgi:hypothetical protein
MSRQLKQLRPLPRFRTEFAPERSQHAGQTGLCEFTFNIIEADVEDVRKSLDHRTVHINFFDVLQSCKQAVAQCGQTCAVLFHLEPGDPGCFTHSNDLVRRQGSRAHAALVASAMDLSLVALPPCMPTHPVGRSSMHAFFAPAPFSYCRLAIFNFFIFLCYRESAAAIWTFNVRARNASAAGPVRC